MARDRSAALLALGTAIEYGLQIALPILLVRSLQPEDVGHYRVAWLIAQTSGIVLSLNVAVSLVYQMPGQRTKQQGAMLANSLLYLFIMGLVAWVGLSFAGPLVWDDGTAPMQTVALFCLFWIASLPYETLGLTLEDKRLHFWLMVGQALVRTLIVGVTALVSSSLEPVLWALAVFALLRWGVTLALSKRLARGALYPDASVALLQATYTAGFGLAAVLSLLRNQVDQWLAATLASPIDVATLAFGAAMMPLFNVIRQSYTNANLATVSQLAASKRVEAALALNGQTNRRVCLLVLPAAGGAFLVAPQLIPLVYTESFRTASDLFRIYLLAVPAVCIETSTLLQAFGHGRFVLFMSAAWLPLSVGLGMLGWSIGGIEGVAAASTTLLLLGAACNLIFLWQRYGSMVMQSQPWSVLSEVASATVIACLLALGAEVAITIEDMRLQLLLRTSVFLMTFVALCCASPRLRREFGDLLSEFDRRLGGASRSSRS